MSTVAVRPMVADDLDVADRVMRTAFGTFRALPDPSATFGDSESVRTRYLAAPDCAWVAEVDGEVVGSVFAARWGSFAFFGPLSVRADLWDRGIGSRLLDPVLESFTRWNVRQAGLFTFPSSPKHLGLYQKRGFWPGALTAVLAKEPTARGPGAYTLFSSGRDDGVLDEIRELTGAVFAGLDLRGEIASVQEQRLGDTLLLWSGNALEGIAVCHCGPGSEAGAGACYVKVAVVRPGDGAPERFERLLDACEAFAQELGLGRLVAGVNTGRLDAYRRLLARDFRIELLGLSMHLHPDGSHLDTPGHHVIADLR